MISDNTMQSTPSASEVKQISALTPHKSRHILWPICAQVIKISPKGVSGNGNSYFKVQLRDQSGYIEALAYNQNVDQYYEQLEKKKNYYFENATLKAVDHNFQNVGHEFEIILQDFTTITECDKTIGTTPAPHLTSFEDAQELEPSTDNPINLLGLLLKTGPLETRVVQKSEKQEDMRVITLMDKTKATLEVTLWSNEAKSFIRPPSIDHPVVLVKGVRVQNKFMGKSVFSTVSSSVLEFNPNIPEIKQLVRKLERLRRNVFSKSQDAAMESDDDKDIIIKKQGGKRAKRRIESDDDDDVEAAHEDLYKRVDVRSSRKRKKKTFSRTPEVSSLETEYLDYDDDDADNKTNSQSSNSSDGSKSDTSSNSSADESVIEEMTEFEDDPLCIIVRSCILVYNMVKEAIEEEEKAKLGGKKPPAWLDSVIDTENCNHKLTELEAVKFSETLGFNWRLLFGRLGIDETYIQRINMDNPNQTNVQINQLLLEWRRMKNEKATLNALLVALKKCSKSVNISWKLIKKNIIDAL